jgi:hypothetical protein
MHPSHNATASWDTMNFQTLKHIFYFFSTSKSCRKWLSTCSRCCNSFFFFNYFKHILLYCQVTVSSCQVLFCESLFGGVAVMHKYIFSIKRHRQFTEPILCKLRTSSKTIIIGVFAELLKSATDFRSNCCFHSFLVWIKKSLNYGSFLLYCHWNLAFKAPSANTTPL